MPLATITQLEPFNINSSATFTFASTSVAANVAAGNIKTDNLLYANGVAWTFGSTYSNSNVEGYLPTYSGLIGGTLSTTSQPNISSVGTLSSLTVSGLVTATAGGIKVGNIQDTSGTNTIQVSSGTTGIIGNLNVGTGGAGNVTATYFIGNGSQLTGLPATYSNADVANYLPTYTGNITSANLITATAVTGTTVYANSVSVTGLPLTYSAYMNDASYVVVPGTGLLGSGDYTVEFWIKTSDTSFEIFASEVGGLALLVASGTFYVQNVYGSAALFTYPASSITNNAWHHVAVVRSSGTVTLYFDGVAKASGSDSTDYNPANAYNYDIGYGNQSGGRYLLGYLSNFRVVNGTAVYTSAFTPSTSPLTAITNTTLLTFQNATLVDNSSLAKSLTVSGTVTYGSATVPFAGLTGGGVTATGNISGDYILGNGAAITFITGANVSGYVPNANIANTAYAIDGGNVSGQVSNALVAGTVYTNAQPNITSVGTLTDLSVSGNATITGNLTVGGNVNYINVDTLVIEDPIIEQGGGANGAPLTTNDGKDRGSLLHYYTTDVVDAFMGWDNSNAEFAFGSNVSISSEVITFNTLGNVRASTFIGSLSGAATTAATVTTNAQPNITSVGTLTSLDVTGNVIAGNFITSGTGGNISGANNITANFFIGDGSLLTGLPASYANANVATYLPTYTGNLSPGNLVVGTSANLGAVGNVIITGGSSGQVLSTDGSGTLSWADQSGGGGPSIPVAGVQVFTADGSGNTYTLTATPANEDQLTVNIDGVLQLHSSFSLSGNIVTLGGTPTLGAQVEITNISATAGATTGKAIAMAIVFGF